MNADRNSSVARPACPAGAVGRATGPGGELVRGLAAHFASVAGDAVTEVVLGAAMRWARRRIPSLGDARFVLDDLCWRNAPPQEDAEAAEELASCILEAIHVLTGDVFAEASAEVLASTQPPPGRKGWHVRWPFARDPGPIRGAVPKEGCAT